MPNAALEQSPPPAPPPGPIAIERLNRECFCVTLDADALRARLRAQVGQPGLYEMLQQRCPHVFALQPVFISSAQLARMRQLVQAVEAVVALPAYRARVLAGAPASVRAGHAGARGVFLGFDFHVNAGTPGLIEINTNAGGAMLNAVLARAQRACCPQMEPMVPPQASVDALEERIVAMFRHEWELEHPGRPLRTLAIVDADPPGQYLYPEFLLFQQLFERHGIRTLIADPAALTRAGGRLRHGDSAIDLVYNRLTDFLLEAPANAVLRDAHVAGEVVVTPHPLAYALYANKRNLALLSDPRALDEIAVPAPVREVLLAAIPRTRCVTADNAAELWGARRHLFFKPIAGFGSRAAYRGDKLTQRVWQEVLAGDYVAQDLVPPGERVIADAAEFPVLKFDVRLYTYDGQVQSTAARLYRGQTTNFRTPGGGFAPVFDAGLAAPYLAASGTAPVAAAADAGPP